MPSSIDDLFADALRPKRLDDAAPKLPSSRASGAQNLIAPLLSIPSSDGSRSTSFADLAAGRPRSPGDGVEGIDFGRASKAATTSTPGESALTALGRTVLGNVLNGSGIGSLVSDLASLFGGGSKGVPALVAFQLPASQEETVYVSRSGSTEMAGTDVEAQTATPKAPATTPAPAAATPITSANLVSSVRQALLTSSSLTDAVNEVS